MHERGIESARPQGELLHPGFRGAYEQHDRAQIEAQAQHLIDNHSEVIPMSNEEYRANARTAIWEGLTESGHLSRIEITANTVDEINAQVLNRLLNGLHSGLPAHEYKRRFAELCTELIIQREHRGIASGTVDPNTAVQEQSDFPVLMLNAREHGYRDFNHKGMSRTTTLRRNANGTYTRIIEQASRSNSTDGSSQAFLQAAGVQVLQRDTPDVDMLNSPALFSLADYDGAVGIQRLLDAHASRIAGEPVMYGDRVSDEPNHTPYDALRETSQANEKMIDFYEPQLANLEARLDYYIDAGQLTEAQKQYVYGQQLLNILRAICGRAPQFAKACFGEKAAAYYERASNLLAMGRSDEALRVINQAAEFEQPVIICGTLVSADKIIRLGLDGGGVAELLEQGKESWKKTKGICRIKNCPSPKPTEIGPCQVCMCKCQPIFDAGSEPVYAAQRESVSDVLSEALSEMADRVLKPKVLSGLGDIAAKNNELAFSS